MLQHRTPEGPGLNNSSLLQFGVGHEISRNLEFCFTISSPQRNLKRWIEGGENEMRPSGEIPAIPNPNNRCVQNTQPPIISTRLHRVDQTEGSRTVTKTNSFLRHQHIHTHLLPPKGVRCKGSNGKVYGAGLRRTICGVPSEEIPIPAI